MPIHETARRAEREGVVAFAIFLRLGEDQGMLFQA